MSRLQVLTSVLLWPFLAALLLAAGSALLWGTAYGRYGDGWTLPEAAEFPLVHLGLALAGGAACFCLMISLYRLHARAPSWLAWAVTLLLYLPLLLPAVILLWVQLVIFGVV
ncbi:MAG: hypothetical protein DWQ01_01615 [Planctomycetota bacterium]|nr:MAG: hypothetical protein DWQ01_01615 [Planctomycetota bacterium]